MADSTPDLTGALSTYAVSNDHYAIFMPSQRIDFDTPIFETSLVVTVIGATSPLVENVDWIPAVADYTAMSQMKALSGTFSASLIRSIQIISPLAQPYSISCSYQRLYVDIIANILARLAVIENSLSILTTTVASSPSIPKLLALDENKTNTSNLIVAEPYSINTFAGTNLILPVSGSFFSDSVVLTIPTTTPPTPLVKGVDYVIIGCDRERTRATTNVSGVYQSILITRQFAGIVSVTYHAYGGVATLSDISSIYETVTNINAYLSASQFLTPDTLGSNAVVTSIIARLVALETWKVTEA